LREVDDSEIIGFHPNGDYSRSFFQHQDDCPVEDDAATAENSILLSASTFEGRPAPIEQTTLSNGGGPFKLADSLTSNASNTSEAARGQPAKLQSNVDANNAVQSFMLSDNEVTSLQPFPMPVQLESPDFSALIDDSLFVQMTLPGDLMDFEIFPMSFDLNPIDTTRSDGIAHRIHNIFQTDASLQDTCIHSSEANCEPSLNSQTRSKSSRPMRPTIDALIKTNLLQNLQDTFQVDKEELALLPSSRMLDNFLWKFFQCFQRHLPIFHVPTFDTAKTPAPLLLAICSIGALYTLNRKHAAVLRLMASDALQSTVGRKYSGQRGNLEPLWQTQTRLLITFGAMFGGSVGDTGDGISDLGFFVRPYAMHRATLSVGARAHEHKSLSWQDWIELETCKRLLCCIYIISSLNSATYDLAPGFSGFRDLNFEVPVEEAIWEAQTGEEWQLLIGTRVGVTATLSAVLSQLVLGHETVSSSQILSHLGTFAITVVMHGVNVHMYYLAQSRSTVMMDNVDAHIGYAVRLSHHTQTEKALSKCQEFLKMWQLANDDSLHTRQEESLIFNCQALLRLSYVRVFSGMRSFNRAALLYENTDLVTSSINAYSSEGRDRSTFSAKAAEQVMFCFTTPIRAGHMLTRKTAAFTWSVEHAVASWECNLFLGKWIHDVETQEKDVPLNQQEISIFESLKEALQDAECSYNPQISLAAQVTRTWADFMDDVWVWEITLRMGSILRQLADVYDSLWQRQRALPHDLQPTASNEHQ
jgi:hypothetical protein